MDAHYQGIPCIVLDDNNTVSVGSRAVCYAKRPLEIWDRLGCAQRMIDKGISWKIGKNFLGDELAYEFDLLPEEGHKQPAMINLQQYYLEEYMVNDITNKFNDVEIWWKHKVMSVKQFDDYAELTIQTPDGIFKMEADWVIACDGANSSIRDMVNAEFTGHFFQDRFLIADIIMKADFPTERWFSFNPPFHRNQSALLHKQSDNVWRLDFQLGWDTDPIEEKKPENVIPRVKAMFGEEFEFELEWCSVYQFACRRIDKFRYGRVLFGGDAAHQVSPFGARGANTGVQDADNIMWKLKLVLDGTAPESLINSYNEERAFAADDNLLNSTRSTDFITPKNKSSRMFRDATLELAKTHSFARPLVNSGRLSMPTPYINSSLNTADTDNFEGEMIPGTNCADAQVTIEEKEEYLLKQFGNGFTLLACPGGSVPSTEELKIAGISLKVSLLGRDFEDTQGMVANRTIFNLEPVI